LGKEKEEGSSNQGGGQIETIFSFGKKAVRETLTIMRCHRGEKGGELVRCTGGSGLNKDDKRKRGGLNNGQAIVGEIWDRARAVETRKRKKSVDPRIQKALNLIE